MENRVDGYTHEYASWLKSVLEHVFSPHIVQDMVGSDMDKYGKCDFIVFDGDERVVSEVQAKTNKQLRKNGLGGVHKMRFINLNQRQVNDYIYKDTHEPSSLRITEFALVYPYVGYIMVAKRAPFMRFLRDDLRSFGEHYNYAPNPFYKYPVSDRSTGVTPFIDLLGDHQLQIYPTSEFRGRIMVR